MTPDTPPESPSALLERAAVHLEALAAQATTGPWRHHDTHLNHGGHTATVLAGEGSDTRLVAWLPSFSHDYWQQDRNVWSDSRWIATMSPAVAQPLVEWLRTTARFMHFEGGAMSGPGKVYPFLEAKYAGAITFARQVLGESP